MTEIATTSFETSAEISAWAEAFPAAQAAMGEVVKNRKNPAFKSQYADLAAVIEAVLPPLNAGGFSVLQPVSVDAEGQVVVSTLVMHKSGQWLKSTLRLRPVKSDPQGVGSATTYARRYGLMALAGVAPEDDDGNAASGPGNDDRRGYESERQVASRQDTRPHPAVGYMSDFRNLMANCDSEAELRGLWSSHAEQRRKNGLSQEQAAELIAELKRAIESVLHDDQRQAAE